MFLSFINNLLTVKKKKEEKKIIIVRFSICYFIVRMLFGVLRKEFTMMYTCHVSIMHIEYFKIAKDYFINIVKTHQEYNTSGKKSI